MVIKPLWKLISKFRLDIIVIIILLGLGLIWKQGKYSANSYDYYQASFGPAVMRACGHGYVNVDWTSSAVNDFLSRKTDRLSCSDVGEESRPLNDALQYTSRYLIESVGFYWRFSGISWSALIPYFIFFFIMTTLAGYGLLRVVLPPVPAGLSGLLLIPMLNGYLGLFRDFSKVLFIYLALIGVVYLVTRWRADRSRQLYGISVLSGAAIGFGFGFRSDLLIYVPFFLLSLMFFVPRPLSATPMLDKVRAMVFFFVGFLLLGWPILSGLGNGSNFGHFFLLGRTLDFSAPLGIDKVPYDLGSPYLDEYIFQLTNAWNAWQNHLPAHLGIGTKEYDRATFDLVKATLIYLPADMMIQATGSVFKIMGSWALLFFISLLGLSIHNRRYFIFALFCLIWLAAYPFLQFIERHFFFLRFLHGFAFFGAMYFLFRLWQFLIAPTVSWRTVWCANIRPALWLVGGLVAGYGLLLSGARVWQQQQLQHMSDQYLQEVVTKEGITRTEANGLTYFHVLPTPEHAALGEYLALKFSPACSERVIRIRMGYSNVASGVIRTFNIDPSKNQFLYFPALGLPGIGMMPGVSFTMAMDKLAASCLSSVGKFVHPENVALPFTWVAGAEGRNMYQTLTMFQNQPVSESLYQTDSTEEPGCELRKDLCGMLGRLAIVTTQEYSELAPGVRFADGNISVDSSARGYLGKFGTHEVTSDNDYLVVEGRLSEGEVSIGILVEDSWVKHVRIDTLGEFRVVIRPKKGVYTVLLETQSKHSRLNISKLGWALGKL